MIFFVYGNSLTGEESIDVQIRPKIDGSFCYLEFDSQGQLNLNDQPSGIHIYT